MANANITAWLNSEKNYQAGVLLYNQYGSSTLLKSLFACGSGAYHVNKLSEALEELNTTLQESRQVIPVFIPPVDEMPRQNKILSFTDTEWDKAPEAIKDLKAQTNQIRSHAELLFHQIRVTGTADQRLAMALEMLADRDKLNEKWAVIKDFMATGQMKAEVIAEAEKGIEEMTMPELNAILKNYPTYISKAKKAANALPDGHKKNKALARITDYETKLDIAKKRLDNVQLV